MKPVLALAVLLAAGCSKQAALNYRHCLKLRIGMTKEQVFAVMGPPEETFPYVEGVTLPHLKGKTAYEWSTPSSMPAPNRVSFDDARGTADSIRCGDAVITAAVFVEPSLPAASTAPVFAPELTSTAPYVPPPRRTLRERGSSPSQSSGRPLTE